MSVRTGLGVGAVVAGIGTVIACVLADPPRIVTPPAPTRPVIVTESVTPRLDKKILAPSTTGSTITFLVPVQVDPTENIQWRVFQDLDPSSANPTFVASIPDDAGFQGQPVADAGATTRNVGFDVSLDPATASGCHTFTFVVALSFDTVVPSREAPPGGDRATWFYEPVADCMYDDAGPPTDASTSGDGADE